MINWKIAEQMLYEGVEASDYKEFLDLFFEDTPEDYKEFSGSGNVKRPNVETRYDILRRACYEYFKLELPSDDENSELDSEVTISGGADDAGGASTGDSGESDGEE